MRRFSSVRLGVSVVVTCLIASSIASSGIVGLIAASARRKRGNNTTSEKAALNARLFNVIFAKACHLDFPSVSVTSVAMIKLGFETGFSFEKPSRRSGLKCCRRPSTFTSSLVSQSCKISSALEGSI